MAAQLMRILLVVVALTLPSLVAVASEGDTVLVLRAEGDGFLQTLEALKDDLGGELTLAERVVSEQTTADEVRAAIERVEPNAVVLLGNAPIGLYKAYQRSADVDAYPPALALSALYVDKFLAGIDNATGIRYEIPAVTSLIQLRALSEEPVRRVGVLYREWMQDYFESNRAFAELEGFELVGVRLPNRVTFERLNYHLRHLVREPIDALWVINDNALLTERLLQNAWLPALRRFDKPVIVGLDALAGSKLGFGTLAVSPDHYALGIQAADRLARIMDAGWSIEDPRIEEPLATRKLVNLELLREKRITIDESRLGAVDQVIE